MIEVPHSEEETPLTWKMLPILGSFLQVLLTCPEGHPNFLAGHTILDDGTVTAIGKSPSVVCDFAVKGCKFHDSIKLLDWSKPLEEEHQPSVWRLNPEVCPFSNGTQYLDWKASNCGRCKKLATDTQITNDRMPCSIEYALSMALIGDGEVSAGIAQRMGYFDNNPPKTKEFSYVWQCGEVDWTEEWKEEYKKRYEKTP